MEAVFEGYLLDTNIAIGAWDSGSPYHLYVRTRLDQLRESLVYVSVVTLAEVEYGLKVAPLIDVVRQAEVRNAMHSYQKLDVDHHTVEVYAEIRAALFRKYSPRDRRGRLRQRRVEDLREGTSARELGIQENDLWIVSGAVQYNLVFVTDDQGGGMTRIIEEANYTQRTEYWNRTAAPGQSQ